jgi:hypothetical protein
LFGTVKPHSCGLATAERASYQTFYCGLCQSLGEHYGQLSRGLHSYDSVFLALLADALVDVAAEPSSCRCPLAPVIHRPTVSPGSPAMRFAAGVQMLLADQFLADRAADGRRGYRLARGLLAENVSAARALLSDLDIHLEELRGFEDQQLAIELPGVTGPAEAAEPTARALSLVFGQIVHLPGASFRARSGATRRALASLGQAVGRVIYLTDALDDLRKDFWSGSFNPCLALCGDAILPSEERVSEATGLLHRSFLEIQEALGALPLLRHRELLENILTGRLRSEGYKAARQARAWVTPAGTAQLVAWKEASPWSRAGQSVLWVMAFLLAWLGQLPAALAQSSLKDKLKDKAKEKLGLDGGVSPPATAGPLTLPDGGPPRPDAGLLDGGVVPRFDAGLQAPPRKPAGLDAGLPSLDAGGSDSSGSGGSHGSNPCCDTCGNICWDGCGMKRCVEGSCDVCCSWCKPDHCIDSCCSDCCKGINCNGCNNCGNCNGCCK